MSLFFLPIARVADSNFRVGSGYKLYFYDAGTTNARNVYTDNTYATPLSNPVVADGNGYFVQIWMSGSYKVRLYTDADVLVWEVDNYDESTNADAYAQGVLSANDSAANAITANLATAPSGLVDQLQVVVELRHGTNTITNPTFKLNSFDPKTIKRTDNVALIAGDTGGDGAKIYLSYSATNDVWILLNPVYAPLRTYAEYPMGLEWKTGLAVTNNSGAPTTTIDVAAGSIMNHDNTVRLTLPAAMTKNLNSPWAAGTGNGGMCNQDDSGTIAADSTYHDYLIEKADGTADIMSAKHGTDPLSDTNAISAGYIYKRRIMTQQTRSGATILPYFLRYPDFITWSTPYSVTTSVSTSGALSASQSPPNQVVRLAYELAAQTTTSQESVARGYISEESQTNVAPTTLYAQVTAQVTAQGLGNFTTLTGVSRTTVDVLCNDDQEFRHRETGDAQAIHINALGWFNDITVDMG